jgi:hypothetical protein
MERLRDMDVMSSAWKDGLDGIRACSGQEEKQWRPRVCDCVSRFPR